MLKAVWVCLPSKRNQRVHHLPRPHHPHTTQLRPSTTSTIERDVASAIRVWPCCTSSLFDPASSFLTCSIVYQATERTIAHKTTLPSKPTCLPILPSWQLCSPSTRSHLIFQQPRCIFICREAAGCSERSRHRSSCYSIRRNFGNLRRRNASSIPQSATSPSLSVPACQRCVSSSRNAH